MAGEQNSETTNVGTSGQASPPVTSDGKPMIKTKESEIPRSARKSRRVSRSHIASSRTTTRIPYCVSSCPIWSTVTAKFPKV
ncbi:hypothetical protein XANCAGTX0491_009651 [Xanthoria calcicola]